LSDPVFATLVKRAAFSSSGVLVGRVSTSLAAIVLARSVGPGHFGNYAAAWALLELCSSLSDVGLVTGLKRDAARSPARIPELLGNTLLTRLSLGIAIALAGYLLMPQISDNPLSVAVFPPLALASVSALVAEAFFAVLLVRGEQWLVSAFLVTRGALFLAGCLLCAYKGYGVITFAWFQGTLYFLVLLLVAAGVSKRTVIALQCREIPRQVFSSLSYGISNALHAALWNIPLLVLTRVGTEEQVGYLAVAYRFVALSVVAGASASDDAFLPALFSLYKSNRSKFKEVCSRMQRLYFSAGLLISTALYACAELIVVVIQGESYRPAVAVLRVLCWSVVILYATDPPDSAMTAGDRMGGKIFIQFLAVVATLGISSIMISRYGLPGASLAKVLGDGLFVILLFACTHAQGLYSLRLRRAIVLPVLAALPAALLIVRFVGGGILVAPVLFFIVTSPFWYKVILVFARLKRKGLLPGERGDPP
jgi:O-antigen/teichoic acid export membrane protein